MLTTVTLQVTLLPPPVTMPLHWVTEVTSWPEVVTEVVQPEGGKTPVAARHAVAVTVDEVAPAEVTVLAMLIVQVISKPAVIGKVSELHCVTAGAGVAEEAAGAPARPMIIIMAKPVAAAIETMKERRSRSRTLVRFSALTSVGPESMLVPYCYPSGCTMGEPARPGWHSLRISSALPK